MNFGRFLPLSISILLVLNTIECRVKETKYYDYLGISPENFDPSKLRSIYSKLAKKWHPDKNPDNKEEAQAQFLKISKAFEVLSDEKKRAKYDRYGEAGIRDETQGNGNPYQDMAFGDIFEQIFRQKFHFGGGGFWDDDDGNGEASKGPPAKLDIQVDLADMYKGASEYQTTITRRKLCPKCKGLGAKDPKDVTICPDCRGSGTRIFQQHVGMGMIQQFQTRCQRCAARGKIFKTVCPNCSGQRIVIAEDTVTFDIPPGAPEGFRTQLEGMSDENPQYETPGDLYIIVHSKPHQRFIRDGPNLYLTAEPLTLREAMLGFQRTIKHLDGKPFTLKRTQVTQPNYVQVIRDAGMPVYLDSSKRGDLFVTYPVVLPPSINKAQRQSFEQLLKEEDTKLDL